MGGIVAAPGDSRDYGGHWRTGCSKPGSGAGDCQTLPCPRFAGCCTATGPSERLDIAFLSTTPGNGESSSGGEKAKRAIARTVAWNINGNLYRLAWGEEASTGIETRIRIPAASIPADSISGCGAERERSYALEMVVCRGAVCRTETARAQAQNASGDGRRGRGSGGEGGRGGQDMRYRGTRQVRIGLGCADRESAKGKRSHDTQNNDRHCYSDKRPLFN